MEPMSTPARGGRATPEQSRAEILDAAAKALWETPLADLTVGELMGRTRLGRSSFYVHFTDLGDLAAALLEQLEGELWQATSAWTDETAHAPEALGLAVDAVVEVWAHHGPVLRAIVEAGLTDTRVAALWRQGVVERFAEAIANGITDTADTTVTDAYELAIALLLLNERYLMDRLGRTPQADPMLVTATLRTIWTRTLYPTEPSATTADTPD